jgi:hypothetical protein
MKKKPSIAHKLKREVQNLDRDELRKAIILREVLGPPKALEKRLK